MADDRTYIRVHDGVYEHPKVVGLSDGAFRLLVESWCYCSRNLTDGRITDAAWRRFGTPRSRRELIDVGLVDEQDGGVEMHDYLEHQRSAEEVAAYKAKKKSAGAKGNHTKHHVEKSRVDPDCEWCMTPDGGSHKGSQMRPQVRPQTARKDLASTETETEVLVTTSEGASHVSSGPSYPQPPLYSDRCKRHGNDPEPGNCGSCADVRKANAQQPRHLTAVASTARPCLIHMEDDLDHCRGCAADRKAAG